MRYMYLKFNDSKNSGNNKIFNKQFCELFVKNLIVSTDFVKTT